MAQANHVEYRSWESMVGRCHGNPNHPSWKYYGGRGIVVCDRWRYSFPAFLEDMGQRPSKMHSIDRIDTNGHYEPANCRWATADVQAKNRRNVRPITANGITQTIPEWARSSGLSVQVVRGRLKAGWSDVAAVTTPLGAVSSGRGRRKYDATVMDPSRTCHRIYRTHPTEGQ